MAGSTTVIACVHCFLVRTIVSEPVMRNEWQFSAIHTPKRFTVSCSRSLLVTIWVCLKCSCDSKCAQEIQFHLTLLICSNQWRENCWKTCKIVTQHSCALRRSITLQMSVGARKQLQWPYSFKTKVTINVLRMGEKVRHHYQTHSFGWSWKTSFLSDK